MKIQSEGFRRVTAEGEFEANQNPKLKFGVLISVACIGSLSLIGKADGKDFAPTFVDDIDGEVNLFSEIEVRHVIEHRTTNAFIEITTDVSGEVQFQRDVLCEVGFQSELSPYLAKVHEVDADSSVLILGSVGTADYESTLFWEFMDVNWGDEDTSSSNQFFSTVHNGTASAGISIFTTVGQAGWASDFLWEGLDINWDDKIAGQIHQGGVSASISINASSSAIETDLESRNASSSIALQVSVGGEIDTIYSINASSSIALQVDVDGEIDTIYSINASSVLSLSINLNSEKIAGWNSETTLIENLNRNWEAT